MSVAASVQPGEIVGSADQRVVLHGVPWAHFEAILALRGDEPAPRMTYLKGELELMAPSRPHEGIKSLLGRMVELYALETGTPLSSFGSWTLKHPPAEIAIEPDECYILGNPRGKDRPDLAIEVIWTSGGLSKLEIYRGLRVPEVWQWREGAIRVFWLEGDDYGEVTGSRLFPNLALTLLARLAAREDHGEAILEFRDAIRSLTG
ncbi:MAG: Uma2 family endonuclease [Thermoanaerobaculia bacterium]